MKNSPERRVNATWRLRFVGDIAGQKRLGQRMEPIQLTSADAAARPMMRGRPRGDWGRRIENEAAKPAVGEMSQTATSIASELSPPKISAPALEVANSQKTALRTMKNMTMPRAIPAL